MGVRVIVFLVVLLGNWIEGQCSFRIGVLKYRGGDWYANLRTSLPNLIEFVNKELNLNICEEQGIVEPSSAEILTYPFIHITGHGFIDFSEEEAKNLREYLLGGGFIHISDNYGLDKYVRQAFKKVFPELDFVEILPPHPIFNYPYRFPEGLPKIHEHDGKRPQLFALIYEGRILVLYDYETDLGDGWEDPTVHNDPPEKHIAALKMGANIIYFVFTSRYMF